jgi:hypothetical protein
MREKSNAHEALVENQTEGSTRKTQISVGE